MTLQQEIAKLSSAEDFFRFFGVAYDSAIVHVSRLHIMKRLGLYLSETALPSDDAGIRAAYSALLERAYLDFVRSTPIQERVFKVHRDAVNSPAASLVTIGGADA